MRASIACLCGVLLSLVPLAAQAGDGPVAATVHEVHFVRNDSGLNGPTHFLVIADNDRFERVFGTVPPLMGNRKRSPVPPDAFETKVVLAVIHQGNAYTDYSDVKATLQGTTLTLSYRTKVRATPQTVYACPLIVSVPRPMPQRVVFVENGTAVNEQTP